MLGHRCLAVMTLWVAVAFASPCMAAEKLGPSPDAKRITGNDRWEVFYREQGDGTFRPEVNYNYLSAKLDLGDSELTKGERRTLWNRIIDALGWGQTDSATITVQAGSAPKLPLLVIQKNASDSQLDPKIGEWRISGLKSYLPGDAISVQVEVRGGTSVESHIVQNALAAATTVATSLGAGPAAKVLTAIPAAASLSLDTFFGKLAADQSKASPTVNIDGDKLSRRPVFELLLYDRSGADRNVIAKLTLEARGQASLFVKSMPVPAADLTPSYFDALLHRPLDGRSENEGGMSLYRGLQSTPLFTSLQSERYESYATVCDQLPGHLAEQGLTPNDITLAAYAFLRSAKGGNKARPSGYTVCPAGDAADAMHALGMPPLPAELYDKNAAADRQEIRDLFGKIATALASARGIQDLALGTVMVWQSVEALPGVPLQKDVARGGDEVEDMFRGLAEGKPGRVFIGKFDFNGQGQLSGTAVLRVERRPAGGPPTTSRYRLTIVLDGDRLIQRIALAALE